MRFQNGEPIVPFLFFFFSRARAGKRKGMNRCLADERTVKIRIISQVLPAVTHDFLFHSTDPSFFHPLFVSKGLWKFLFSLTFSSRSLRAREGWEERRDGRSPVEEKGNDWLPILESHACYWEPICSSSLRARVKRKKEDGRQERSLLWNSRPLVPSFFSSILYRAREEGKRKKTSG